MIRGPFLTLPNLISLARVPLAVAAVAFYASGARLAAQLLMAGSFLTDALDGAVARMTDSESEWGRVLDPLADKLVFAVFAIAFASFGVIPWWIVFVLIGRDVVVTVGGILHMGRIGDVPASNVLGKASTLMMAVYLFKQAFWPARPLALGLDPLGWLALAVLLASTLAYVLVYLRHRLHHGSAGGALPKTRMPMATDARHRTSAMVNTVQGPNVKMSGTEIAVKIPPPTTGSNKSCL
jgi:cardiolipin synthase (CMP-forming)